MILDEIIKNKKAELLKSRKETPLSILESRISDQDDALDVLTLHSRMQGIKVIAEIKKASPSKGVIRQDFNHTEIAKQYSESGAFALSVLTDRKYFQGEIGFLDDIRKVSTIPLLRKDFTVDPYNIYEARAHAADMVLLIVSALEPLQIKELLEITHNLGMNAVVEVHSESELETALDAGAKIVGINNRDLRTFEVSLDVSKRLSGLVPDDRIVIAESGITGRDDIRDLMQYGIDTFLVGETFMRAERPGEKLKALLL